MVWTVTTLGPIVDAEIEALPADMRARLVRLFELIEKHGLGALPRDSFDHLEGRLWELRIRGRDGNRFRTNAAGSGRANEAAAVIDR